MKKLLVVLLALTAVGVAAFADAPTWTFGAVWNTGAQIKLGDSTTVPDTLLFLSDNNEPAPTRGRFVGNADLGGYGAKWYVAFPSDDPKNGINFINWWVYANLFNKMVTLNVGAADTGFAGTVNKGWGGANVSGIQVIVAPIDGLKVGFGIPVNENLPVAFDVKLNDQLQAIQLGAFYTMPNLASFAFTYVNKATSIAGVTANSGEVDFGVNVLAVPNLTAQFEVQVKNLGASSGNTIELFENAAYVMGPLTPAINLDEVIDNTSGANMKIAINPNVDYAVMTGTNVGISITYTMNTPNTTTNSALSLDPYVKFTFNSSAAVKIDGNFGIADLNHTDKYTLPININFMYSF